ncbi:hypothetical protein OC834_005568 [Tilletia horrida]|nr:hypothetical protein OC834_005568 [Tilletia horrida]
MVVPPALPTAVNPATEDWDNDDDFDFGADGDEAGGGLLSSSSGNNTNNPLALRRPASFTSDVDVYDDNGEPLGVYSGSSGSGDHRGPASISGSASSRTSRSGMSSSAHTYRSTDLTDPEGSPRNSFHSHGDSTKHGKTDGSGLSPQRAYDLGRPLSTSPTAIATAFSFNRQNSPHRQGPSITNDASSELELDFELGDGVQQLHLAPSTLRKRPSAEVWDADAAGADNKSGSDIVLPARSSPSPSHRSLGDSDNDGALGDDESEAAEPIEDGLDLPESIFGKADGGLGAVASASTDDPSAKLRAMLDARLRGQHSSAASTPSRIGKGPSMMDRLAGGVLDFDADTDVVTGLIITDDLDLSPSRLAAKSLSFKTRRSLGGGSGSGGFGMTPAHTIPRSQQQAPSTDRQRPSGSNVRTWTSSPSTAQLPTLILTNSSPAHNDRSNPSQRSPPRAMSSYSHAPGAGPRANPVNTISRADPFRSVSPSLLGPGGSSAAGSGRNQALLSPDSSFPHSLAQQQQRKSLIRKRSMPLLNDQSASPSNTSTSAALSAVHDSITANTSALARLMASTAASRAREAETAARLAARTSPESEMQGERGSPVYSSSGSSPTAIRMPPSRPSTPVNGAVRYNVSLTASRFRRVAAGAAAGAASVAAAGLGEREGTPSGTASPRPGSAGGRLSMYSAITASAAAAKDAARVMRRPTRPRNYGTGNELDAFDDLPTNQEAESRFRRTPLRQASNANQMTSGDETLKVRPRDLPNLLTSMKDGTATLKGNAHNIYGAQNAMAGPSTQRSASRAGSTTSGTGAAGEATRKRSQRGGSAKSKKPTLIRNLGGNANHRSRVVGDMRWNPAMQRWEGNESALRAFDNVVNSSSRPALISPLTTSSVSSLVSTSSSLLSPTAAMTSNPLGGRAVGGAGKGQQSLIATPRLKHTSSSPAGICSSFVEPQGSVQGTRIVGDMMFDPVRMCWFSMAGTEEPDVFAELGEDDDEDGLSSSCERGVGAVSSSSRRRNSGLTTGGGWSSGWGGMESRAGRSSTAPTTDEEDEMSKSVGGGSDFGALHMPPGSPSATSGFMDSSAASSGLLQPDKSGSALLAVGGGAAQYNNQQQQQQQLTLTARRIKSADLLRSTASGSLVLAPLSPSELTASVSASASAAAASTSSPLLGSADMGMDDEELRQLCVEAETRHRKEVRGFLPKGATSSSSASALADVAALGERRDSNSRSHLYLLQRLAREAGR